MDVARVADAVGDVPHTTPYWGKKLYRHVVDTAPEQILELGFAHGVSLCYMAAALDELGGTITAVDLPVSQDRVPTAEELLDSLDLRSRVDLIRHPVGYNWTMMRMLEESPEPRYDFCFLDGAHNWLVDGFAFFLADRLLRPDGWILFDDLDWTYEHSPTVSETTRDLHEEVRSEPQIRKVFELLAMQHPNYSNFHVDDRWGWAQKCEGERTVTVSPVGAARVAARRVVKIARRVRAR